ncbi:MAG: CcrSwift [Bradyrhizobium sp.]|nr:CcrSwift [Bradyrhizobium sp.]
MTTIAYRDGVLAADTGMTIGDSRIGRVTKIVRGPNGNLGGAAGSCGYAQKFREWVAGGEQDSPPEPKEKENSFSDKGVVFRRDGTIDVHEVNGRFSCCANYYAFGSGRPEALGAMFAGADAETAIRAAIEHDSGTFGEIDVLGHD